MAETFTITVPYRNREMELDGEFEKFGYSYRLIVFVEGAAIIFEPDEERIFRAHVRDFESVLKPPEKDLIKAIGEKLEELFH